MKTVFSAVFNKKEVFGFYKISIEMRDKICYAIGEERKVQSNEKVKNTTC